MCWSVKKCASVLILSDCTVPNKSVANNKDWTVSHWHSQMAVCMNSVIYYEWSSSFLTCGQKAAILCSFGIRWGSNGIHTCTEAPWAAPNARRFRWTRQDISKASLWYEPDGSLCQHYCLRMLCLRATVCEKDAVRGCDWVGCLCVFQRFCDCMSRRDREVQRDTAKVSERRTWINK